MKAVAKVEIRYLLFYLKAYCCHLTDMTVLESLLAITPLSSARYKLVHQFIVQKNTEIRLADI